MKPNINKL